jgi:PAS domain S-box-containing protein
MQDRSPAGDAASPSSLSPFIEQTVRRIEEINAQDFGKLSRRELENALEQLTAGKAGDDREIDRLERMVHEMQVYRCELEMQNRALRESQELIERAVYRYTELYDSLPIGYITLTPSGQVTEANETACRSLHVDRERLKGAFFRKFLAPGDACALAAHLAACNRSASRQIMEATLTPKNGPPIPVQLSSCRTFPEAEVGFLIRTAFTDITDSKRAQKALQDALAEHEEFTHSISHDLRSPLITISNFSTVLAEDHASDLSEDARHIVQRMRRAALRMDDLLKNLVSYSRLSRAPASFDVVDVEAIVRELESEHLPFIASQSATLEIKSPLAKVLGSRALLTQVLGNLLTNALKFTAPNRPPVVRISTRDTAHTVVILVADRGIGIPPQHHERVFKIFEKLHRDADYSGTGIGLAMARRAVERMHGRIWFESEVGQGTTFFVELPKPVAAR